MRILQVVESFGGGVGRHVVDLVSGLVDRGHEVDLVYSSARMDKTTIDGLAMLQRKGVATFELPMKRSPGLQDFSMVRELKDYIRKHGPFDIVHGQSSKGGALARLGGRHYPAAIVYTPHAISTMNPRISAKQRMMWGTIERNLAKRSDAIIAVSPEEERHLIELGIPAQKVRTIINGVDLPEEAPDWKNHKVVGFVGRLEFQKHPENLIEAFARNADKHPDWRLTIVGYGPLEESCRALAQSQGIANRVDWLGNQPGGPAMSGFGIFCMPSRYEAMPYVLLEALAAGCPIISTDCGGAKVAIHPDKNGVIVPIESPVELAMALDRLMGDESLRRSMSAESWRRAQEFTVDSMVTQTLKAYADVSDGKRLRGR